MGATGGNAGHCGIERELYAAKRVMQSVLAEREEMEDTLMQVKEAGETLKRQLVLTLCTSGAELASRTSGLTV